MICTLNSNVIMKLKEYSVALPNDVCDNSSPVIAMIRQGPPLLSRNLSGPTKTCEPVAGIRSRFATNSNKMTPFGRNSE